MTRPLSDDTSRGDLLSCFQRHYDELARFLTRLTGSRDQAQDLAHDTYLRLSGAAPQARVEDMRAYVFRAAANLARDRGRQVRRRGPHGSVDDVAETLADRRPGAEDRELARERLRIVGDALDELPEVVRRALLMNRIDGLTHAEIARRLGTSESSVAKHVTRALLHCRRRLDQPGRPRAMRQKT